jgi:Zn-dependent protease
VSRPGRWCRRGPGNPEGVPRWIGVGLGRVLGIPVRLDVTWFAGLAVLVALSRELWAPEVTGVAAVALSGVFALAFFASVVLHELAHAVVARAVGVPTTEIRLFVFGGVARIAGEPADPGGEALVAMAGPLASVLLAGLLDLTSRAVAGPAGDLAALLFLGNLVVAGFNLLPGFPLDGGRVARALVWRVTGRRLLATRLTALLGRVLAAVLVLAGTTAALWQRTPRWLPQVVLGLFLWQAAGDGERSAARAALLAERADPGWERSPSPGGAERG